MQLNKQELMAEFIAGTIGLPTLTNKQADKCAEICHRQIQNAFKTNTPIDYQLKQLGYNPDTLELRGLALIRALKENVELKQQNDAIMSALYNILSNDGGCPMCDNGQLRNVEKEHFDNCFWNNARLVYEKYKMEHLM